MIRKLFLSVGTVAFLASANASANEYRWESRDDKCEILACGPKGFMIHKGFSTGDDSNGDKLKSCRPAFREFIKYLIKRKPPIPPFQTCPFMYMGRVENPILKYRPAVPRLPSTGMLDMQMTPFDKTEILYAQASGIMVFDDAPNIDTTVVPDTPTAPTGRSDATGKSLIDRIIDGTVDPNEFDYEDLTPEQIRLLELRLAMDNGGNCDGRDFDAIAISCTLTNTAEMRVDYLKTPIYEEDNDGDRVLRYFDYTVTYSPKGTPRRASEALVNSVNYVRTTRGGRLVTFKTFVAEGRAPTDADLMLVGDTNTAYFGTVDDDIIEDEPDTDTDPVIIPEDVYCDDNPTTRDSDTLVECR